MIFARWKQADAPFLRYSLQMSKIAILGSPSCI